MRFDLYCSPEVLFRATREALFSYLLQQGFEFLVTLLKSSQRLPRIIARQRDRKP
jgi:hypothetical protein